MKIGMNELEVDIQDLGVDESPDPCIYYQQGIGKPNEYGRIARFDSEDAVTALLAIVKNLDQRVRALEALPKEGK